MHKYASMFHEYFNTNYGGITQPIFTTMSEVFSVLNQVKFVLAELEKN